MNVQYILTNYVGGNTSLSGAGIYRDPAAGGSILMFKQIPHPTPGSVASPADAMAGIYPAIVAFATTMGWTMTQADIVDFIFGAKPPRPLAVFNNAPGRGIVTGTGATGFQPSAVEDMSVQYSATMQTTATIAGNASDILVLEIAPTNSATLADWVEIGRLTNAQTLTLALTLQSVQTTAGVLAGKVPAGWYAKVRAITVGTVSNTMVSGQESPAY